MAKIRILSFGDIKSTGLQDLHDDFLKRISKYLAIQSLCLKDLKYASLDQAKYEHFVAESIKENRQARDYVFLLDRRGKTFSSKEFSVKIEKKIQNHDLLFVIGGATGFSEAHFPLAHEVISFSPMTFPHQFFRVMLLEQIYRAFAILKNEPYAK